MLELISTSWSLGALTSRPDRGPSPRRGWWAPVAQPIKRRWGLTAQDTRFAAATIPHLKTLTRSERVGCSGGKRHHAITDVPDPRRSSTGDTASALRHRRHSCTSRRRHRYISLCTATPSLFYSGAMSGGNGGHRMVFIYVKKSNLTARSTPRCSKD